MKIEDLIIGEKYTFFGITILATTGKREGVFNGINENGNMIITMRQLTPKGVYKSVGTRLLPFAKDMFVVKGFTQTHGIYVDSEIPTRKGISFEGNALYNLCHEDKDVLMDIVKQTATEEQLSQVMFYRIINGIRSHEGKYLIEREEEVELWP